MSAPKHVVILVHGTFAENAEWVLADSPLSQTLRSELGSVEICPFRWSGKNSHTARLNAAYKLSKFLSDVLAANPGSKVHLIAHSHGGNVVLYALRDRNLRDTISSVAFLGTPFISVSRRDIKSTVTPLKYAVPLGFSFPLTVAGLLFFSYVIRSDLAASGSGLGLIVMGFLLIALPIFAFIYGGYKWLDYVGNKLPIFLERRQTSLINLLSLPVITKVPMYVIRARGDEAAGYLRLVDQAAGIPFRLWHPIGIAWFNALLSLLLVGLYVFAAFQPEVRQQDDIWEKISGLSFFLGVVPVALTIIFILTVLVFQIFMILWTSLIRGHALGFGDRLLQNWLVHVDSNHLPIGSKVANDEESTVFGKGLKHSLLYQDSEIAESIAQWVKAS